MPSNPSSKRSAWQRIAAIIEGLFGRKSAEPEPGGLPGDPYAYVTAPKKPRTPNRSAAAVMELPER
ncbi:MAG TPA: hypothetical protein VF532_06685 [Candidatus Angelobacter sp.]